MMSYIRRFEHVVMKLNLDITKRYEEVEKYIDIIGALLQVHCKLHPMQKGKGKNADIPTADDGYTWSALWQNSHRSHHRPQFLHNRKPTYPNYHWSFDGMARSFSHCWQKGRHYCVWFYQKLSPQSHVSQIHTVWQWTRIQKPPNGQCSQAAWHQLHLFCPVWFSKQWKTRGIP